jgi:hypothetical protein
MGEKQKQSWFRVSTGEARFDVSATSSLAAEEATLGRIAIQPGSYGLDLMADVHVAPLPQSEQPPGSLMATYQRSSELAALVIHRGVSRQE